MTYTLGIDVGIASVGFAGVLQGDDKILFSGVHIFEAAENPKTGASLAEPRREKRGMRRVIGRRSQRKKAIRRLFIAHGLQDIQRIDLEQPKGKPVALSVWDLRKEALLRKLTDAEFARVLFHISKRRGFQSNRKGVEANDTEGREALKGAKELEEAMFHGGASSVGAYLATLPKKRNGNGTYDRLVTRDLLRDEVKQIFEAQKKFGNTKATDAFLYDYAGNGKAQDRNTREGDGIAFYQRPLQSSEHLVGECTFEAGEKRAPKHSYTAELFVLWGKINNTRIKAVNGDERPLSQEEKNQLSDLAHKNKGGVTYKQVRKSLPLSEDERFNIGYRQIKDADNSWEKIRDTAETSYFFKLTGYHALKAALDTGSEIDWQNWVGRRIDDLDDITRILSFYEDKKQVDEMLSKHNLSDDQKGELCNIKGFSRSIDLSLIAVKKILPYMQAGRRYDEACDDAGFHHSKRDNKGLQLVPPFDDIRNPVVNRSLAQTRKVINACIRKHGLPEKIIVEMAREVGKNFSDRKEIERDQKKNENYRNEARQHIAEILGTIEDNVRGEDIIKYRLWKEQKARCCYCGSEIKPEILRDSVATQIDHIIPYSRSWNNSYMNKTLCHTSCNQEKGNKTPYEWLNGTQSWKGLVVEARNLPPKKAENMLIENYDEKKMKQWKDRALNDTRYIAKLLKNHLEENLDLGKEKCIHTRNGSLTFYLRNMWGFKKKNRGNDRHHALDAIVIASSTQSMVQELSSWNRHDARRKNPSKRQFPPKPWDTFRDDAIKSVNDIFVSRMPVRKVTGSAHKETIYSIRKSDGKTIQRVKLSSLTLAKLENLVDKERNIRLYNVLKARLDEHGGNADTAFAEPIYMPINDASKTAPAINSVRIVTKEKPIVPINGGAAKNDTMPRVDVFCKDNRFYLVPIYVHHFTNAELPNKAIVAYKDEKDWLEMDDNDFIFSLCKNDLVHIKSNTAEYYAYYVGTDRATGSITIRTHDRDPDFGKGGDTRTGVKMLLSFEKYSVNYFGEIHKVGKEKRLGVAQCNDTKSS